jgi:hypothetical protein
MGKVKDAMDWFGEKTEKMKDIYGTGIEAFNISGEKAKEMMGFTSKMRWKD